MEVLNLVNYNESNVSSVFSSRESLSNIVMCNIAQWATNTILLSKNRDGGRKGMSEAKGKVSDSLLKVLLLVCSHCTTQM